MSSLSFYQCDKCGFLVRNSYGFPYHKDKITEEYTFFKVPVGPKIRDSGLIDGYKCSKYCIECKEEKNLLIDNETTKENLACPTCLKINTFLNIGDTCPKCMDGKMDVNEALRVLF